MNSTPIDGPQRPVLPRRISPTAINAYRVCPRQVWFRYVAKVPRRERPSPLLMLGNAVHGALDTFFGLRPQDRQPVEPMLHRCLRAVWPRHRKDDTFVTREEERDWGEKGLRLLSQFAEVFDTKLVPLVRERWVETRLANGVVLFGKVDRVDGDARPNGPGVLTVIDYKTGRWVLDDDDLADEPAAQAYLLAVEDEYAREVEQVRWLYLDPGTEARWEPEREDIEAARQRLLAITSEMYRDLEFPAQPGEQCGRCAYAHLCPEAGLVEVSDLEVEDNVLF